MKPLNLILMVLTVVISCSCSGKREGARQERPNILFIAVDDLNDWVGCLGGHPQTRTPNIDRLASRGVLFTSAHCQAPLCGPSRASVMTGLYPSTTGNYLQVNDPDIRKAGDAAGRAIFLPDYLEQFGYRTLGVGKIYHNGDDAGTFDTYGGIFDKYGPKPPERMHYDPAWLGKPGGTQTDWGAFPAEDSLMPDYRSAAWAVEQLQAEHDRPFFLAVGFIRPHVPWHVPQKWFDRFPADGIRLPPFLPSDREDLPGIALRVSETPPMPETEWMIETGQWDDAVRAYLACIHFVDAQIGRVLDALEESPYRDNTIVVLWSDHGYHMGEKNRFAKQSLWNRDTRTVLAFKVPGGLSGRRCDRPVQLADIYPTLAELCGLPPNMHADGHSLAPLLENPDLEEWPHVALSFFGKDNTAVTGESMRLIRYADGSCELYDLAEDPYEWHNLAGREAYREVRRQLEERIPASQAGYSPWLRFDINEYFRAFSPEE